VRKTLSVDLGTKSSKGSEQGRVIERLKTINFFGSQSRRQVNFRLAATRLVSKGKGKPRLLVLLFEISKTLYITIESIIALYQCEQGYRKPPLYSWFVY
jgi:hypothetical protein